MKRFVVIFKQRSGDGSERVMERFQDAKDVNVRLNELWSKGHTEARGLLAGRVKELGYY